MEANSSDRPFILTAIFYYTIPVPQYNDKCAITILSVLWTFAWFQPFWPAPGRYPRCFPYGMFLSASKSLFQRMGELLRVSWPGYPPNRIFQRQQNVLLHSIFICMVQNLCRWLGEQSVPELFLFCRHFFIELGILSFVGHCILFYRSNPTTFRAGGSSTSSGASSINVLSFSSIYKRMFSSFSLLDFSVSSSSREKGVSNSACVNKEYPYKETGRIKLHLTLYPA